MLCPYCQVWVDHFEQPLGDTGELLCPECGADNVPELYPEDYESHPAVPVSIFGPTGHGKTVYIDALITHLEQHIDWPDFSPQWMDPVGMLEARTRLRMLKEHGRLPDATAAVFPRPQVIRMRNVPRVGGSQLLFYDAGGEVFANPELLKEHGRYVQRSPAVVWLVSLTELEYAEQLNDLLTVYAAAMARMKARPKDQAVIVALTKGDLLLDRPDLPQEARDLLHQDNLDPAGDAWERLEQLSTALENWLRKSTKHKGLVNLLKAMFKTARFCILSAQGMAAEADGTIMTEPMPRGVLAPLFWLWRETLPIVWVETGSRKEPFFNLADAARHAPTGAIIRLGRGAHVLPSRLEISRPIRIIGDGPNDTFVRGSAEGFVAGVLTEGEVTFTGLTLLHTGDHPADVIRVMSGNLTMQNCAVRGAIAQPPGIPGDGIVVARSARATVTNCIIEQNHGYGVSSRDQARLVVRDCQIQGNGKSGVAAGGADADIRNTHSSENGESGIHLTGKARGVVHGCTCKKNRKNGITALLDSTAELANNTCDENSLDGIVLKDRVTTRVQTNGCTKNRQAGISIHDTVTGEVSRNRCIENVLAGIEVEDRATPAIELNRCTRNRGAGIAYTGSAAGSCIENTCDRNHGDGIVIAGRASPEVDRNTCLSNGAVGFRVTETASPAMGKENSAQGNAKGEFEPPKIGKRGWFG